MGRFLRVVLSLLFGLALFAALALVAAQFYYEREGPLEVGQNVVIPRGSSIGAISQRLEEAGVIEDARAFHVAALVTGKNARLRAGEYAFPAGVSFVPWRRFLRNSGKHGQTVFLWRHRKKPLLWHRS